MSASLLCNLLPEGWRWKLGTFLKPERVPCTDFRACVDLPSAPISQPDLSSYPPLNWDLFKCSLSIQIHHYSVEYTEGPVHQKILCYPVLTCQLEPIRPRHFLPPEGPECERFSQALQQAENEVISLLDPMLQPVVSSSKRLYWARTQPTSFFKSHVLYKPGDEWTNFYMAVSSSTIALCTATIYGDFDHHDHVYINRLQVTRLPLSQESLKHAQELICQATGGSNTSYRGWTAWSPKPFAGTWAVLDASECYATSDSAEDATKTSFTQRELEEELARMMHQKCSIIASVGSGCMKHLAEMEGKELFAYLQGVLKEKERQLQEQAVPAELRSMLDDLKETLQGQFSSAEEYVELQNKHDQEVSVGQKYWAPLGCQWRPKKEDNMETEEAADVDHAGACTSK